MLIQENAPTEKVRTYEVTTRDIRRFTQAIGEDEPSLLNDGAILAPSLFCQIFMFEDVPLRELPVDGSPKELCVPLPPHRNLGGSSDFEFFSPIQSGNNIKVKSRLKEIVEKNGKSGRLYLVVIETTFLTQQDQLIARETATFVKRAQ